MDEETGLYYYGARYMNPVTSLWYGVDPLTEDYKDISSYLYCHANPVVMTDPDGLGDYYTKGGKWLGTDGDKNGKIFITASVTLNKYGLVGNAANSTELNISYAKFIIQASTVYGESSAYLARNKKAEPSEDLQHEMYAIASVRQRNKKAFGVTSAQAVNFRSKSDKERNNLPLMRTAIAAEINAISGGKDYSNGATMWDGAEQAMFSPNDHRRSTGKFEIHMNTLGWYILLEHYSIWKRNVGNSFKVPRMRQALERFNGKPNFNAGKMRLRSTAVYGRTIFWRESKN
jgi:RHS repeat-associated protein